MSDGEGVGCMTVFVIALFIAGLVLGASWATSEERNLAVKAGVGRWTTDPKTGHTNFVYGVAK